MLTACVTQHLHWKSASTLPPPHSIFYVFATVETECIWQSICDFDWCIIVTSNRRFLTNRDKMADMEIVLFQLIFQCNFLSRLQGTISHQWLGNKQATSHCLNQWWPILLTHICVAQHWWDSAGQWGCRLTRIVMQADWALKIAR